MRACVDSGDALTYVNSVTDLQSLVDMLPDTGGTIRLGSGLLSVGDSTIIDKPRVHITGNGRSTVLLMTSGVYAFLVSGAGDGGGVDVWFYPSSLPDFELDNLVITQHPTYLRSFQENNFDEFSAGGVYLKSTTWSHIHNVMFRHLGARAIIMGGFSWKNKVSDCNFLNCAVGNGPSERGMIEFSSDECVHDTLIVSNQFSGLEPEEGGNTYDSLCGIFGGNAVNLYVHDNTFEHFTFGDYGETPGHCMAISWNAGNDCDIQGNMFEACDIGCRFGGGQGKNQGLSVVGNKFLDCFYGIDLGGSSDVYRVLINSNTFRHTHFAGGIHLFFNNWNKETYSHVVVNGNDFDESDGSVSLSMRNWTRMDSSPALRNAKLSGNVGLKDMEWL